MSRMTMPVEFVARSLTIDDLAIQVTAYRYICDGCGSRGTFPDNPMPEGHSEVDASRKGWRIYWDVDDQERCRCPHCSAKVDARIAANTTRTSKEPE